MTHFVYAIGRRKGPIKIGIIKNLGCRLSSIQTGCPFKVYLFHHQACRSEFHARQHERGLHEDYKKSRLHGEWFDIPADLAIEAIETSFQIEEHFETEARNESLRFLASGALSGAH